MATTKPFSLLQRTCFFYPFVRLNVLNGLGIFALSSYCAIIFAAYAIARNFTTSKNSLLTALITGSYTLIPLQAVTLKNDIIMAAIAAIALMLSIDIKAGSAAKRLILIGTICSFGIGAKTTFLAFIPGLFLCLAIQLQLWRWERLRHLLRDVSANRKYLLLCLLPIIIHSQVWLFTWNTLKYESWSGPAEFVERNQQHDGPIGMLANGLRYTIQTAQLGQLSDMLIAETLNVPPPSAAISRTFDTHLEPLLNGRGAPREPFQVTWITHEDLAWFGLLGAILVFLVLPYSLIRRPRITVTLLPALLYLIIVCSQVAWMPWNGRFMTVFFVCSAPAWAISLREFDSKQVRTMLLIIAVCSLFISKTTDFSRPLFTYPRNLYLENYSALSDATKHSIIARGNCWQAMAGQTELHNGSPSTLLDPVPHGATVGIYLNGHHEHYGFYHARPDVHWVPINHILNASLVEEHPELKITMPTAVDYLVLVGTFWSDLKPYLKNTSKDSKAFLIEVPQTAINQSQDTTTNRRSEPVLDSSRGTLR